MAAILDFPPWRSAGGVGRALLHQVPSNKQEEISLV